MQRTLIHRIPEQYRFLGFLVITSMIGITLILYAVYNASKELEIIHEVDNLHRFASAQLNDTTAVDGNYQHLLTMAAADYQVLLVRDSQVLIDRRSTIGLDADIQLAALEETRVNLRGGYLEHNGQLLTWTRVPLSDQRTEMILLHRFAAGGMATLKQVYSKRVLVPAIFYIWLMIWMALIVRFLTDKLSQQKNAMEHMALHDALSGLPNRNLLTDRLHQMIEVSKRKKHRFALVMIDLDGFKKINDTHGHEAGDVLLREIAQRLSACLRSVDTVARVGGDEFILLLDDLEQGSSLDICTRAAAAMAKPVLIQNTQVSVGSSIGIANFPEHGKDPQTLTRKADQAMYAIKAEGGGIRMHGTMPTATETPDSATDSTSNEVSS